MKILRNATTAAALSIAGAGLVLGGVGLATADDSTPAQTSPTQVAPAGLPGQGSDQGPGPRGGPTELAAGLADALGLQEADVLAAMQTVHDKLEPNPPTTPPTQAELKAHQAEMTSALADKLGVSEQKLTDALDSMAADHQAAARSGLASRLDAAVADGSLTKADKQSVLKAFDAGVLGDGPHGPEGAPMPRPAAG